MDVLGLIGIEVIGMGVLGGYLGRMGLLTPYMGGLLSLSLGVAMGLPPIGVITGVVCVYLSVFFSNGIGQGEQEESTDLSMALNGTEMPAYEESGVSVGGVTILKVCGLMVPLILGFTGFGVLIDPFTGIILAAAFSLFILPFNSYSNSSQNTYLFYLACIVQCVLLVGTIWIYKTVRDSGGAIGDINPVPGIIASVSVWGLLFGERKAEENPVSDLDNTPYVPIALSAALCLCTPGLTSGVVSGALTNPGRSRIVSTTLIEAFIEGVVLSRFIKNSPSGKTMLGELLQSDAVNLINATDPFSSFLFYSPLIAFLLFLFSLLLPQLPFIERKYCIAFISIIMSVITIGPFTILFLAVGFILYIFRRMLPEELPDTRPLSFLYPLFIL
jgi:hypothetical protein